MTLTNQLAALEASGLILLARLQPEVEYLFRHALVQEAAYQSLVKIDRRMLHQAVAEALEYLYPSRLASPELAPVLARHFGEAGDYARDLHYSALAGRASADVYANAEAIRHFGRALDLAQALKIGSTAITDLFLRLGRTFELNAQDAEALENYRKMEAWAASSGDQPAQLAAIAAQATIYVKPSVEQNLALGYELSQKSLALARELHDPAAEAKALWNLLQYYLGVPDLNTAIHCGEQALAIAREHNLREQAGYVLTDLHKAYYQVGQPDRARAALEEAVSIFRELGILNMLADNLASISLLHALAGSYDQALLRAAEAQQISRAIGNLWNQSYSRYMLDLVHFDRGDVGQALAVAEECLRLAEQAGFADGRSQSIFDLALIYGYMGDLPRALATARRLQEQTAAQAGGARPWPLIAALLAHVQLRAGRLGEAQATLADGHLPEDEAELRQWFPLAYMFVVEVRCELALATGDYQRALTLVEGLIPYLRQIGVRLFLTSILLLRGRALRAAGQEDEAQSALEAALAEAEDLGSRRVLWQILAELATLAAGRGDRQAALALRREAAEVIAYIAEHAGSAKLSESFLNQAAVRDVLLQSGGWSAAGKRRRAAEG